MCKNNTLKDYLIKGFTEKNTVILQMFPCFNYDILLKCCGFCLAAIAALTVLLFCCFFCLLDIFYSVKPLVYRFFLFLFLTDILPKCYGFCLAAAVI